MKAAIMIDGGFYQKRARALFGNKTPKDRACELIMYCNRHLKHCDLDLYRIFYYDCPPSDKVVYHPLTQKNVPLRKEPMYAWTNDFFVELANKRKVAIRKGELLESELGYTINADALKRLCKKEKSIDDLTESDFHLDITQKGVDMRIGLDIASIAQKRQADQIILIAGDSDFVPAAKHARREGIDFILDPMWHSIKPSLNEHIDGLYSCVSKPPSHLSDPLCKLQKTVLAPEQ